MTEADWQTTADPLAAYQEHHRPAASRFGRWFAYVGVPSRNGPDERKLRLFLAAWFRAETAGFPPEWAAATADVVAAAEDVADGDALPADVAAVIDAHWPAITRSGEISTRKRSTAKTSAVASTRLDQMSRWRAAAHRVSAAGPPEPHVRDVLRANHRDADLADLADLVRCVFGSPYRRAEFAAGWRTEAVVGIATAIYADRVFGNLPVLADALEDAGCADAAILDHCRHPGPHARGCWVVDAILRLG